jgi:hypothetical protein
MKTSLVYLVLLLAVIGQPVGARDFTPAASALLKITDDMPRETVAKTLFNYCIATAVFLPTKPPWEDVWIEEQIQSGNRDALDSPEVSRRALNNILGTCINLTLLLTQQLPARPMPLEPATEAVLWARVAMLFTNPEQLHQFGSRVGLTDIHALNALHLVQRRALRAVIESLGKKP